LGNEGKDGNAFQIRAPSNPNARKEKEKETNLIKSEKDIQLLHVHGKARTGAENDDRVELSVKMENH
jgi:hypothetical protein